MSLPAVFIDRDGVVNVDHGYVSSIDSFEYIEGVFDACRALKERGYLLVLVTNQAGIARGYFSEQDFLQLTEWMDWNFADKGVDFDGIYYCPHHPSEGSGEYRIECECRKPKPGMLLDAAKELNIDLVHSVMVGDKADDMIAAEAAGITTRFLVRSGKPITEQGVALATEVVNSIADIPTLLSRR
ncbi:D-glycero-beta-D-manno-heptose-1,7-bisphosphate 7-phosphatase [Salinivibrio kushneri]|uniref:D,D-heptose 1,7-bisphosphate phosphatase n=1 Tax=Salinivibrio kushneri TaxID=1908198 RepID=A0AB36K6N2_9GAMM|nr:D-glycero-beta-D-manno-heptose 1,7-bisphosphate 7-phosphatase [Salinivibrio kushneri]OOE44203.1 D-glycero-beta-D-manno-heptose-1,7-bisphosphate 7-phosphatase [Salinivibrio kushneri]OOE47433.1 D-glycero-beta-D-manno-heptose-1,7-bisphosphate 7-phosphatase [Salinivibrio kushneri]